MLYTLCSPKVNGINYRLQRIFILNFNRFLVPKSNDGMRLCDLIEAYAIVFRFGLHFKFPWLWRQ